MGGGRFSAGFVELVRRCLLLDEEARPQSAAEVLERLDALAVEPKPEAQPKDGPGAEPPLQQLPAAITAPDAPGPRTLPPILPERSSRTRPLELSPGRRPWRMIAVAAASVMALVAVLSEMTTEPETPKGPDPAAPSEPEVPPAVTAQVEVYVREPVATADLSGHKLQFRSEPSASKCWYGRVDSSRPCLKASVSGLSPGKYRLNLIWPMSDTPQYPNFDRADSIYLYPEWTVRLGYPTNGTPTIEYMPPREILEAPPLSNRFRPIGGGAVLDARTGLAWTGADKAKSGIHFAGAVNFCRRLGGGWRLPDLAEVAEMYCERGVGCQMPAAMNPSRSGYLTSNEIDSFGVLAVSRDKWGLWEENKFSTNAGVICVREGSETDARPSAAQAPQPEQAPVPAPVEPGDADPSVKTVTYAVFFAYCSTDLLPDQRDTLEAIGRAMKSSQLRAWIVGHASSREAGVNCGRNLGGARALAVYSMLASEGVDPGGMSLGDRADAEPVADNSTSEGAAQNRRVVIKLRARL
jgi:outer membrane protein OmpA-like peptidoglycan-associated protein